LPERGDVWGKHHPLALTLTCQQRCF